MRMKALAGFIFILIGAGIVTMKSANTWNNFYCSTLLPLTQWTPVATGLFKCSNIIQSINPLYTRNILIESQPEMPGYNTFRPQDETQPAVFRITVKRDCSRIMLLPRFNGQDCRIQIFEIRDELKRKLFDAQGTSTGWTPIGQRYELNLGCVSKGDTNDVFDVVLEVVLTGKWMQLWALNNDIFF